MKTKAQKLKMTKTEKAIQEVNRIKSIKGLIEYRNSCNNVQVISHIKTKIDKLLSSKGYKCMSVSYSNLDNTGAETQCNSYSTVKISERNRTFKKYAGKTVKVYVNHKQGTGFNQIIDIYVK